VEVSGQVNSSEVANDADIGYNNNMNNNDNSSILENLPIEGISTESRKTLNIPTVEVALAGTNPKFDIIEPGNMYNKNCQRCVQAYELRRRGYDVEARPKPIGIDKYERSNAIFVNANGQPLHFAYNLSERTIKQMVRDVGEGARHIIYTQWQSGGAHVFIAENINGTTRYVDPQSNEIDVSYYFKQSVPEKFGLLRIDNAKITNKKDILNAIVEVSGQ